jgi:hypothetical protein
MRINREMLKHRPSPLGQDVDYDSMFVSPAFLLLRFLLLWPWCASFPFAHQGRRPPPEAWHAGRKNDLGKTQAACSGHC